MSGEWIEHDGSGVPVPVGTMVDMRLRSGAEVYGAAVGGGKITQNGEFSTSEVSRPESAWVHVPGCLHARAEIIAYRLAIDPQAECDRISARQAMFRKWANRETTPAKEPKLPRPIKTPERASWN